MKHSSHRQPRVLVVGALITVPGHLAAGSAGGFRKLGFEVRVHDVLGASDSLTFKLYNRARLRFRLLARAAAVRQNHRVLQAVRSFRPDLCFIIRSDMLTERTLRTISRTGAAVVNWSVDDPYQLRCELRAAHAYDHVFVFDRHYIEALRSHGVRSASYLSMGCDPDVHRPIELTPADRERYGADVAFVGTHYANREEILKGLRDLDLAIWGGGWRFHLWKPDHPLRPAFRGPAMGMEMVKIYNAARVVLNVQHPQSIHAQNMRAFEAPACGALTITPETDELPHLYDIGREIVAYRDEVELAEKIRYYLDHPEEATRIAAAGRRRAARDHSYEARMREVLRTIGFEVPRRTGAGATTGPARLEPAA